MTQPWTPYDEQIDVAIAASDHPETIIAAHDWRTGYRNCLDMLHITGDVRDYIALPRADFEALVQAAEAGVMELNSLIIGHSRSNVTHETARKILDALARIQALRGE